MQYLYCLQGLREPLQGLRVMGTGMYIRLFGHYSYLVQILSSLSVSIGTTYPGEFAADACSYFKQQEPVFLAGLMAIRLR